MPNTLWGMHCRERVSETSGALALAMALAVAGGTAYAQTPPDAGALQQQIERDIERPLPEVREQPAPAPKVERAPVEGVTVTVSAFTFNGNTRLSNEQLQAAVAKFVGKPLTFSELQGAPAAVADAYREAGWIVRVFLPQQALVDGGTMQIQIVEAKFGEVQLQKEPPEQRLLVDEARLRAMAYAAQEKGGPVSAQGVDRALLVIDDLPGISAGGSLAAGKVDGETDLQLRVANERRFVGDVRVDNAGSRSTGAERLSANFSVASPTRIGDVAMTNLLFTEGSHYGRVAYRRPVGYGGWSAGLSGSVMEYELVGKDFAAFDSTGSATTFGIDLAYPLLRGRQTNLSLQVAPEHKTYDNKAAGITTTHYSIDALPIVLNGSRNDAWGGGGSVGGNLSLVFGKVDLTGSPNEGADAITTETAGNFAKLRYGLNRQQKLTEHLTLWSAISGQITNKNLDSAEKFYIGGSSAVRAYSSSDGSGSEGTLVNVELRARLPWRFSSVCFYDWGTVLQNVDNKFPAAPLPNSYELQGAGVSLAWAHPKGVSAKVTWSRRIGDNPNPDPKGNDQDGELTVDRFWMEAGYAF